MRVVIDQKGINESNPEAGTGSGAMIDSTTTISGSTPDTNDLSIGALGNRSHAQLTAATLGTLNDSATAGGSCVFASRG